MRLNMLMLSILIKKSALFLTSLNDFISYKFFMDNLIKRKNLKAKKGKKKWARNLDVSELLNQMEAKDTAQTHK